MMYQQEKATVDNEILHEKKHQLHKLDHTKEIDLSDTTGNILFYTRELFANNLSV
jgi:hypothetical protein